MALHREIKFVEVTEEVHRRIVAEQFEEVAFDRRVHETFTDLSMKRVSATGIVEAAARMLDEPVVLEDLAHQALAVAPGPGHHGDTSRRLGATVPARVRRAGEEGWAMTAVGPRGEEWGRLIVPRVPADTARAKMVLERAAAALALNRMIERDRSGLHQQAQSGLIDEVLRNRISDEREIAARAHALGLRKASRYFPVVVRVRYHTDGVRPAGESAPQHGPARCRRACRERVGPHRFVRHSQRRRGRCRHRVEFQPRGRHRQDMECARRRGWTARSCASTGCSVRCSRSATPAELVTDAVHGLGRRRPTSQRWRWPWTRRPRPFYRASDVRLRGLISLLQNDPRVQGFAETELKALLTAETAAVRSSDLTVLREYLRLAGNKAALAARLHISRPSLYKRLDAIERTLGVDLSDAESMVSLHVAMLVLETRRGGDSGDGRIGLTPSWAGVAPVANSAYSRISRSAVFRLSSGSRATMRYPR